MMFPLTKEQIERGYLTPQEMGAFWDTTVCEKRLSPGEEWAGHVGMKRRPATLSLNDLPKNTNIPTLHALLSQKDPHVYLRPFGLRDTKGLTPLLRLGNVFDHFQGGLFKNTPMLEGHDGDALYTRPADPALITWEHLLSLPSTWLYPRQGEAHLGLFMDIHEGAHLMQLFPALQTSFSLDESQAALYAALCLKQENRAESHADLLAALVLRRDLPESLEKTAFFAELIDFRYLELFLFPSHATAPLLEAMTAGASDLPNPDTIFELTCELQTQIATTLGLTGEPDFASIWRRYRRNDPDLQNEAEIDIAVAINQYTIWRQTHKLQSFPAAYNTLDKVLSRKEALSPEAQILGKRVLQAAHKRLTPLVFQLGQKPIPHLRRALRIVDPF